MMSKSSVPKQICVDVEEVPTEPGVRHLRVAYTEFSFLRQPGGKRGSCWISPSPVGFAVEIDDKIYRVKAQQVIQALCGWIETENGLFPDIDKMKDRRAPPLSTELVMSIYKEMLYNEDLRKALRRSGLEMPIVRRMAEIDGENTADDFASAYLMTFRGED
jgi:hypothetical protein